MRLLKRWTEWCALVLLGLAAGAAGWEAVGLVGRATPFPLLIVALFALATALTAAAVWMVRRRDSGRAMLAVIIVVGGLFADVAMVEFFAPAHSSSGTVLAATAKAQMNCRAGECGSVELRVPRWYVASEASTLKITTVRSRADTGDCEVLSYFATNGWQHSSVLAEYRDYRHARTTAHRFGLLWLFDYAYPNVLVVDITQTTCFVAAE